MAIGTKRYSSKVVPDHAWKALRSAVAILIDELHEDLESLAGGAEFKDTMAFTYLPAKHLPRYNAGFVRRFLVSLAVVGWKLFDTKHAHTLACLAEELALHAIVQRAGTVLEEEGQPAFDFMAFEGQAFEDTDFEALFDPSEDGIEDTESGKRLGITNLKFHEWFVPFNAESGDFVHPYVDPAQWQSG